MSANNGTAYIGRAMRRRRERCGMTLADVASVVGVSEATVSRWETGAIDIAWRHIVACARALDVPVGALLAQTVKGARHE